MTGAPRGRPDVRRLAAGVLLALVAAAGAARADVWEDPDLATALERAAHVVRVRAPAEGSRGKPVVAFTVERDLHGVLAPGTTLQVTGLHDPTATVGPSFGPGEQVWLILHRPAAPGPLRAPTPTFGRYPLRDGVVQHATPRDTWLRLALPEEQFVGLLRLHLGQRDAAWLAALREHLGRADPKEAGAARATSYVALEALALAGEEADAARAERFLDPEAPFQLRISAVRALGRALGVRAAPRLVRAIQTDPEPAVRTAAADELARRPGPPALAGEGLARRLVALVPEVPGEPVRFAGPNDPRLGTWPAPRVAVLRAIGRADPAAVRDDLLALLDRRDQPLDVFTEVLRVLLRLREDRTLPRALVARLRDEAEDAPGVELENRELCAALSLLTRLEHGLDVEAWRAWAREGE